MDTIGPRGKQGLIFFFKVDPDGKWVMCKAPPLTMCFCSPPSPHFLFLYFVGCIVLFGVIFFFSKYIIIIINRPRRLRPPAKRANVFRSPLLPTPALHMDEEPGPHHITFIHLSGTAALSYPRHHLTAPTFPDSVPVIYRLDLQALPPLDAVHIGLQPPPSSGSTVLDDHPRSDFE